MVRYCALVRQGLDPDAGTPAPVAEKGDSGTVRLQRRRPAAPGVDQFFGQLRGLEHRAAIATTCTRVDRRGLNRLISEHRGAAATFPAARAATTRGIRAWSAWSSDRPAAC